MDKLSFSPIFPDLPRNLHYDLPELPPPVYSYPLPSFFHERSNAMTLPFADFSPPPPSTEQTETESETEEDESEEEGVDSPSVVLTDKKMWKAFSSVGNEMIVTKSGRRMFPNVLVTITGLAPSAVYTISIQFVLADKYRHKFVSGEWQVLSESDILHNESRMDYTHPLSPNTGEIWMKKPISFKTLKITHHSNSNNGNILLHTMHKYTTQIIIKPITPHMPHMVFPLKNTTFIAVTSYQSSAITKLKVENNPFARGFRDRQSFIQQPSPSQNYYHPLLPPPLELPTYLPPPPPLFFAGMVPPQAQSPDSGLYSDLIIDSISHHS